MKKVVVILMTVLLVLTFASIIKAQKPYEGETVTLALHSGWQSTPFYEYTDQWKEETGAEIRVVEIPYASLYPKMMVELAGETGAFDIVMYSPAWIGDFAPYLEPMDEYLHIRDPELDDIIPAFRDRYCYYGGKLYGLTYDGDVLVPYYRADLFADAKNKTEFKEKYGYELAPPATWEEYLDIAQFFTRDTDDDGVVDQWGATEEYQRSRIYGFMLARMYGYQDPEERGLLFDPETMKPLINTPAAVKGEDIRVKLRKYTNPGTIGWGYEESARAILSGDYAMGVSWTGWGRQAEDPEQSNILGNLNTGIMPNRATLMYVGFSLGITKASKNPELAYDLISLVLGPEISAKFASDPKTGLDPYRYSQFEGGLLKPQRHYDAVPKNIEIGYPELRIPGYFKYMDILDMYLARIEAGEMGIKEGLDQVAEEWEELTDTMGREKQKNAYLESISWKFESFPELRPTN